MRARTFLGLVAAAALAACGAPTAPDAAAPAAPALSSEAPADTTGGHGSGYLGSGNNTTPPGGG